MKIERFEEIQAWQEARKLTKMIYGITGEPLFSKDYGLKDQIQRASVSVMSNIAEGFDSQSDADFIKFLIYSRKSATEVQSHLYVALDQEYISEKIFHEIYNKIVEIKNLINGFIRYLKNRPKN